MVFSSFSTLLALSLGNFSTWPILSVLLVRLFILFSSSTVVLYLLAMEYKESPFFTVYVDSGNNALGIFSNCPVDRIKDLNNLTTNLLSIGQVLLIPTDTNLETTYTVQKGDSLYSIAKKYNTTVDRLKQLNNLSSNLLSIGQILIVR